MDANEELEVIVSLGQTDGREAEAIVHLEIEIEGQEEPVSFAVPGGESFLDAVRDHVRLAADVFIFERDQDNPLGGPICGRKAIRLVGHRARQLTIEVRYDHLTKHHHSAPSRTVFRVLQWAIGKHGFNLDAMAAAKANLILPGADAPLPREAIIGKYVPADHHTLVLDLTLRDFTNGSR